jgi:hypothetical protein
LQRLIFAAEEATPAGGYWAITGRIFSKQRAISEQAVQQPTEAEILRPYNSQQKDFSVGRTAEIAGPYSIEKRPRLAGRTAGFSWAVYS